MNTFNYTKTIVDVKETEVLVIGGGTAGFAAAVASARHGAKTMLIERSGVLGGMATSGLVGPFMTSFSSDGKEQVVKGIFEELIRRLEARGGALHPSGIPAGTSYSSYYVTGHNNTTPFLSETLAVVMDEMLEEAGVELLLYTQTVDVVTDSEGNVNYVVINKKEGLAAVKAGIYVDATGDADVAYAAGVPTVFGDGKGLVQPSSLFFEVGNINREKFIDYASTHTGKENAFVALVTRARLDGKWHQLRNDISHYEQPVPGRWKINCSRVNGIDGTSSESLTKGTVEGRRQVQEIAAVMREYVPGCERMQVLQVASVMGIRESRHVVGLYTLTLDDLLSKKNYEDSICTYSYGVDIHGHDSGGVWYDMVKPYNIPYRCLVTTHCNNMLVAGRCISGTNEAAGSYRVMPCCFATGQAAGTAAAISSSDKVAPKDVDVKKLQYILLSQNCVIHGCDL